MTTLVTLMVPEDLICKSLQRTIDFLRTDYAENPNGSNKLYLLFGSVPFGRSTLYHQAKALLCTNVDDPMHIVIDLMFNQARIGCPSIHVTMPAETPGSQNEMSFGEELEEFEDKDDQEIITPLDTYKRIYRATYNIVVVGISSTQCLALYYIFKALLLSLAPILSVSGLHNITISGAEIAETTEVTPTYYMRVLSVGCEYETKSLSLQNRNIISGLNFIYTIQDE